MNFFIIATAGFQVCTCVHACVYGICVWICVDVCVCVNSLSSKINFFVHCQGRKQRCLFFSLNDINGYKFLIILYVCNDICQLLLHQIQTTTIKLLLCNSCH